MGVSTALIWGGIWIISCGWQLIHKAQGKPLVVEGIYSRVRHPQYLGLFMIIIGLLIQWPTIISLVMAPILFWSYVRLARREEREMVAQFGEVYQICRETVPAFVPRRPGIASASFHDTQEDVSTQLLSKHPSERTGSHATETQVVPPRFSANLPVFTVANLRLRWNVRMLTMQMMDADTTVLDEVRAIRDGGGFGSIIGRNVFQRPKEDALRMLNSMMQLHEGEQA